MKMDKKRIISCVLAAILSISPFLQTPTAVYAAKAEPVRERSRVTVSVGEHGTVRLTDPEGEEEDEGNGEGDSKGDGEDIRDDTMYVLGCDEGSVWKMEIIADEGYEISEYTVEYPEGSRRIWDPQKAENREYIVTELTMEDGMEIVAAFVGTASEEPVPESGAEGQENPDDGTVEPDGTTETPGNGSSGETDAPVPDISIRTAASVKETGAGIAHAVGGLTIGSKVSYTNLTVGEEYTVKETLLDKETGTVLTNGQNEISAEMTFTAGMPDGSLDMDLIFDASGLRGHELVLVSRIYFDGQEAASDEGLEDADRTVRILDPVMGSDVTDGVTGSRIGHAVAEAAIVDKVTCSGLIPGYTYQIEIILVDKGSGSPILINGKEVTAGKEFTAATENGSAEIPVTFDASALGGKTVTVSEKLYHDGLEILHKEVTGGSQTVTYLKPSVSTTALDKASGTHDAYASEDTAVTVMVNYSGLIRGEEYTVKVQAWDADTGKPLLIHGKEIVSEKKFKADKGAATVNLEFTFDSSGLNGKTAVFCTSLLYRGNVIAENGSLDNDGARIDIRRKTVTLKGSGKTVTLTSQGIAGQGKTVTFTSTGTVPTQEEAAKEKTTAVSRTEVVQTADRSPVTGWLTICALAAITLVFLVIAEKRKRHATGLREWK